MAGNQRGPSSEQTQRARPPGSTSKRAVTVLAILAVLILAVLAFTIYYLSDRNQGQYTLHSAPVREVVWSVPSGAVSDEKLSDLKQTVTKDKFVNAGLPSVDVKVNVTSAKSSGEWTVLTGQLQNASTGEPAMTELITVIERGQGASSQVITGFDPGFCGVLRQVPPSLIPPGQRNYWVGCRG